MKQEEGRPLQPEYGAPQSRRTTTKRNTAHARAHGLLRDALGNTAICLTAIGLFVVSAWGAEHVSDHLTNLTLGLAIFTLGFIFGLLFAVQS
jgi:hypothetical protein